MLSPVRSPQREARSMIRPSCSRPGSDAAFIIQSRFIFSRPAATLAIAAATFPLARHRRHRDFPADASASEGGRGTAGLPNGRASRGEGLIRVRRRTTAPEGAACHSRRERDDRRGRSGLGCASALQRLLSAETRPVNVIVAGAIGLVSIWIFTARAVGLYGPRHGRVDELLAIVKAACVTWLLALVLGFFAHLEESRLTVAIAFGLSIVLVVAGRALTRRCIRYFYAHPDVTIPLVVVGSNSVGRYVRDRIVEELSQYEFLGFIDNDPAEGEKRGGELLGGTEQIAILAASRRNLEAAIVLPDATPEEVKEIIDLCGRYHVRWRVMPWVMQLHAVALKIDMVGTIPLIGPRNSNIEGLNWVIKRGFDVIAFAALLVLSAPLLFISGLMIWLFDGRPLLFRQTRVGIHGKPFELLKFRTMGSNCGENVHREYVKDWIGQNGSANAKPKAQTVYKLDRDPRVTPIGAGCGGSASMSCRNW